MNTYRNDVGGHEPFRLKMNVGKKVNGKFIADDDANDKIEAAWKKAGRKEYCCANRTYSRAEMYWRGDCGHSSRRREILYQHIKGYQGNPYGYAIKPIEIDRLDYNFNRAKVGKVESGSVLNWNLR